MLAVMFVDFYRWWYGHMNLKGAGILLSKLAHLLPELQSFPLVIPGLEEIKVDFRDTSAFVWQNFLLGKKTQKYGLLIAMSRFCKSDSVLWDIGANIGMISAHFSNPVHNLRAIHAFEPNPVLFASLQALFCNSRISHIHNIALSSDNTTKQLHVPCGDSCLGSLSKELVGNNTTTYTVVCRTVDDLVASGLIPPPTLVKIDVEGHEAEVIKGMQKTIAEHRPVIFLEHIFMDANVFSSFDDYSIMTISDVDGSLLPGFIPDYGHNVVMMP